MSAFNIAAATGIDATSAASALARLTIEVLEVERVSRGRYRWSPNGAAR